MSSIITNEAAMAALSTLRSISADMNVTQNRMTTGAKVDKAADNAAYWSIATTMKSDDKALSAVQDALNLGSAVTNVAYSGLDSAIKVTDEIKKKLVAASQTGIDKDKVNMEITRLKDQLRSVVDSSSFNGINWLKFGDSSATTAKVAAAYYRDLQNGVFLSTLEVPIYSGSAGGRVSSLVDVRTTATSGDAGILTSFQFAKNVSAGANYVLVLNDSNRSAGTEISIDRNTSNKQLSDMISVVDGMLQMMTDAGANFGSLQASVNLQADFTAKLRDWIHEGVSRLIDADMNEEATRLKALTTQQQLTIQALSIANSKPQAILQLFN
ncbi:flagellin [Rhizobium oryzicola]|uniref:Flagellin n=1 Tax=Rhizobium oryzicola TaxID=1232668 RepID=A0ABT8ST80_9HYPH|nr:flagellin [Rhizobium oryzicola]MDO1581634.1 flagellin [Rhizobium oryzicola]